MALMAAFPQLQARCEIGECAALRNQRALRMADSICASSYEGHRSGSSRPNHTSCPELAAWSRACDTYHVSVQLRQALEHARCRASCSEHAACGRAHSSQSSDHTDFTSTGASFTPEHLRGEPHGAPWRSPLGRAARSQSDEGDETKKYAVEGRSTTVYLVEHATHSTLVECPSTRLHSTSL